MFCSCRVSGAESAPPKEWVGRGRSRFGHASDMSQGAADALDGVPRLKRRPAVSALTESIEELRCAQESVDVRVRARVMECVVVFVHKMDVTVDIENLTGFRKESAEKMVKIEILRLQNVPGEAAPKTDSGPLCGWRVGRSRRRGNVRRRRGHCCPAPGDPRQARREPPPITRVRVRRRGSDSTAGPFCCSDRWDLQGVRMDWVS